LSKVATYCTIKSLWNRYVYDARADIYRSLLESRFEPSPTQLLHTTPFPVL